MTRALAILACLLGCAWAQPARGHADSTSFLTLALTGERTVAMRWDLAVHDLVWFVFVDADVDGRATPAEIAAARPAITRAVQAQIAVTRGAEPCGVEVADMTPVTRLGESHLSFALRADCPASGRLAIGGPLFLLGDDTQRVLVAATRGSVRLDGMITASAPVWEEPARASAAASFARFVGEGVWHVLIGFDHIAFILLLLLPSVLRPVGHEWRGAERLAQVWRDLVWIVTAFTVAHSITLALAATGTVMLPSRPVEIAIAASIVVAALVNLLPRAAGWRLPLAFGFGLVHGFGFANVLGELDTGGGALVPLLAGFNVGVELAQLAIVAVVLPMIYAARRTSWYAASVMPLGSCALGAAGLVWLVQRL